MSRAVSCRPGGFRGIAAGLLASSCLIGPAAAEAELVFKRPNGSAIQFDGTPRAWCGPWDADVARRSVHVEVRDAKRGWALSAVRRDIGLDRPIEFPSDFVWNKPRGAQLFVFDRHIEASTAEEESKGSMVFSRVGCRPGDVVGFSVRALLGSELFGGKPVRVSGSYRGYISSEGAQ